MTADGHDADVVDGMAQCAATRRSARTQRVQLLLRGQALGGRRLRCRHRREPRADRDPRRVRHRRRDRSLDRLLHPARTPAALRPLRSHGRLDQQCRARCAYRLDPPTGRHGGVPVTSPTVPDSVAAHDAVIAPDELLGLDRPLLADGATGTNYMGMGLGPGEPPELWNVDSPDKVRTLHQSVRRGRRRHRPHQHVRVQSLPVGAPRRRPSAPPRLAQASGRASPARSPRPPIGRSLSPVRSGRRASSSNRSVR